MIYLDFETYSEADLKTIGSWNYSKHPSTEILCMAFAIEDEPVQLWNPYNDCDLTKLFDLIKAGSIIEAHNAFFERVIWQNNAVEKLGFPQVQNTQWRCSAARVAALSLPRKLEEAAKILNTKNQKDMEGHKIMLKLSTPRITSKKDTSIRYNREDNPEMYERLYSYCKQDVETERDITKATRQLGDHEQQIWFLDQEINTRGVPIDKTAVETAIAICENSVRTAISRVKEITNGEIDSYNQVKACVEWINNRGVEIASFDKPTLEKLVEDESLPSDVRELIEIRQNTAKTSTAKYQAMLNCIADDNRIRDNYMYHGASTGRWTGKNVQFQNIPRGKLKDMETAVDILKMGDPRMITACYDLSVMDFMSSTIRGMITASEGKQLYVADYSAIEARGVAWISGQEDLLNDFRNNGKIYEKQAAFTYGKPVEQIGKDSVERFVGKTLVLACGYGMGGKKFQLTCANQKVDLSLDFCEKAVKSYRGKNSKIVSQWYAQENAAILAVRTGKPIVEGKVTWFVYKDFLYCKLPSKRCLAYFKPCIKEAETSWGSSREQLHITGEKTIETRKVWCEYSIYGGLIVENIVQAICRDLVAYGMLAVQKAGYDIIMHSHDEIISEVPLGFGDIKEYEKLMCSLPDWALDFPIKSEGWVGKHYKK
jgi:DNA polymerase